MFTSALPRCSLTLHARPPGVRVKASLYLVSFDPGARLPSEPPRPVQASLPLWRRKKNVLASDDKQRMLFGLLLHNLTSTWSHVCSGPEVWVKHSFLIPVYVYVSHARVMLMDDTVIYTMLYFITKYQFLHNSMCWILVLV